MSRSRIVLAALFLTLPLLAVPQVAAAAWPWSQSAAAKAGRLDRVARSAHVNKIGGQDRARLDAIVSSAKQLAQGEGVTVRLHNAGLVARLQGRPLAAEIRARGTNELLGTLSGRTYVTGTSISAFVTQLAGELKLVQPNKPLQAMTFRTGEMFGDL